MTIQSILKNSLKLIIFAAACLLTLGQIKPTLAAASTHDYDKAMHNSQDRSGVLIIKTNPDHSFISLNGVEIGQSPLTMKSVPRDQKMTLTIKKKGYETKTIPVDFGNDHEKAIDVFLRMQ